MEKVVYYPIRIALTFDETTINVVRIIDDLSTDYIQIPYYHFETFISKCLNYGPLFILEKIDLKTSIKKSVVEGLVVDLLEDNLANYVEVSNPIMSSVYQRKYSEKGIAKHFHKPLWLCSFYSSQ